MISSKLSFSALGSRFFLIIGAQKSGTTSLYDYMCRHPDIVSANAKEIHYFSLHFNKGSEWYRSNFASSVAANQVTGEATPYYLFHPYAAERINLEVPEARLIAVLRDPVERAISHYFHAKVRKFEDRDIFAAMSADADPCHEEELKALEFGSVQRHQRNSYVQRGFYTSQLLRYEELFPKSSLLILTSDQLYSETRSTMKKLFAHLAVRPDVDLGSFPQLNQTGYTSESIDADPDLGRVRSWLTDIYSQEYAELKSKYGVSFPSA